eukprot:TRINITY_DN1185_c0_g1_i5.p1 TRINITY_DN1185_c0_g1~~TRINITY_DN1185_c0_g1_i5.p1  ORF type:complete len:616 (-),score=98.18 TRINITY_DN1185_c0_g1_i5:6-1676(-)
MSCPSLSRPHVIEHPKINFKDYLLEKGVLPAQEIRSFAQHLCKGLMHCHAQDVAHRDIRPSSLLLLDSPSGPLLKISDFRFAKQCRPTDQGMSVRGARMLCYSPPEQLFVAGRLSELKHADMWAAGCTIARMARCWQDIFEGDDAQLAGPSEFSASRRKVVYAICEVLGTPCIDDFACWPLEVKRLRKLLGSLPALPGQSLRSVLPSLPNDLIHIVQGLLDYSTERRLSAEDALYWLQCETAEHEADVLRELKPHPNIAQALHLTMSCPSLSRPHVIEHPKINFKDYLLEKGVLPAQEIRSFAQHLCKGLMHCHAQDVAHRDIRPSSLLLFDSPSGPLLKITDFRVAKPLRKLLQDPHVGDAGTHRFMPFEQLFQIGNRYQLKYADMWAAGCTVARMAMERDIFEGDDAQLAGPPELSKEKRMVMYAICEVLGTPCRDIFKREPLELSLLTEFLETLPQLPRKGPCSVLPLWLPADLRDLVQHLLCYSMKRRFTAMRALDIIERSKRNDHEEPIRKYVKINEREEPWSCSTNDEGTEKIGSHCMSCMSLAPISVNV